MEPGSKLSRYRLGEKLGAGGMGVVYRAFDTRLERPVALKVLPPEVMGDAERRERFVREARAASALNHPNIVVVFDVDRLETDGGEIDVLAMELVEGESLDRRLAAGPLEIDRVVDLGLQLAAALAAAHRTGIVHRDVKPSNLVVDGGGRLKLLDFGLARTGGSGATPAVDSVAATRAWLTTPGVVLGTPAYMAPEQARGHPADARSDVFAAGQVLYEMLTGRRAFVGHTAQELLISVARDAPEPIERSRPDVPAGLREVVERCLAKDPDDRYASAVELVEALTLAADRGARAPARGRVPPQRRIAALLAGLLLVIGAGVAALWWRHQDRAERRAREGLARLETLVADHDAVAAYRLVREIEPIVGEDPALERLRLASTWPFTIRSSPPGAAVAVRGYLEDPQAWIPVGTTPLERIRLPAAAILMRLEKAGYETLIGAPEPTIAEDAFVVELELWRPEEAPLADGVRVAAGPATIHGRRVELGPFWIGRHEVTNREYQAFVEAGGYEDPVHWAGLLPLAGGNPGEDETISGFVDATGRPGPATWRLGRYPDGRAEHPVAGVSWFEASAYARWAGAELPTVFHWIRAAEPRIFSEILEAGNFGGEGTVPVGATGSVGPFGTLDMAGNVFEWTSTGDGAGARYLAGGSFHEPGYLYIEPAAGRPGDRSPDRGFRVVHYPSPPPPESLEPLEGRAAFPDDRQPVSDERFAAYRGFYDYDPTELRATVDAVDDRSPHYRRERVSYAAAYGGERVPAHLFLPRHGAPPYQVVVFFPPSPAEHLASSEELDSLTLFEFLPRSGRAVLLPVYENTYERRIPDWEWSPTARRDVVVQWRKDLGRTLDYVASRDDLDEERIAYYGYSLGAVYGPVLTALEPRIDAAVLFGGGLVSHVALAPEADPFHFAPRVRAATLMITGRDDFVRPVATHQAPLLELLGPPPERKKLVELDGGHVPRNFDAAVREILGWLDRWLGPVGSAAASDRAVDRGP